ncbi:unnamed protein product [Amoebophrya sp. A25]|nr:unnamed protein product [Amoebophrya sp. A25]|eukprot:GSA25T00018082001.1
MSSASVLTRLLWCLALVPTVSFLPSYVITLGTSHQIWSGLCNCAHENPNWALWTHIFIMFVWINMLFPQLLSHTGGTSREPVLMDQESQKQEGGETSREPESDQESQKQEGGKTTLTTPLLAGGSSASSSRNPPLTAPSATESVTQQQMSFLHRCIVDDSLPSFLKNNCFFPLRTVGDLKFLHQSSGYAAYFLVFGGMYTAVYLWSFPNATANVHEDDSGNGYVTPLSFLTWSAGSTLLNGQEEGISVGGKPVASTDLYTEFLLWMSLSHMAIGILYAIRMRGLGNEGKEARAVARGERRHSSIVRLSKGIDEISTATATSWTQFCEWISAKFGDTDPQEQIISEPETTTVSPSSSSSRTTTISNHHLELIKDASCTTPRAERDRDEQRTYLLERHKEWIFMGILWITDPAIHRFVWWGRIIWLRYVYFPIMQPDEYNEYVNGQSGNFELFKLWTDMQGQYFALSVGKMWVNLSLFFALGCHAVRRADEYRIAHNRRRKADMKAGRLSRSSLKMQEEEASALSIGHFSLLHVVNLVFISLWFWLNGVDHMFWYQGAVPLWIYGEILVLFTLMTFGIYAIFVAK